MLDVATKQAGRVLTPSSVARALCQWAVRSPSDLVLDLGVGEGAFALAAFERLRELGGSEEQAAAQIAGAELDPGVFARAQLNALRSVGRTFPNVVCADFGDLELEAVDAVVGNPPYIRRHYQDTAASLRRRLGVSSVGLTDIYCFFLLRASQALRPGGRLAVLVSASWLDMRYGQELKRHLNERFTVHLLLGFRGRLFTNALVKPVVILAEKTPGDSPVSFAQLPEASSIDGLESLILRLTQEGACVGASVVPKSQLAVEKPWSTFFRDPHLTLRLAEAVGLKPLGDVADTRIGLQTFAKGFFVLGKNEVAQWGIESDFLAPLIFSPRYLRSPVVAERECGHCVFFCDQPREALAGTAAGRYVSHGLEVRVQVRGTTETVEGYNRAPRLARARRTPWYNIKSEIERRGSYPILLPRRVFKTYLVAHNMAGAVANEDFIEVRPFAGNTAVGPLLSFLNSRLGEYLVRSHAFQYGGGVFNLNPGRARDIPAIDFAATSPATLATLQGAWDRFVAEHEAPGARDRLSDTVESALAVPLDVRREVATNLELLAGLPAAAQKPYLGAQTEHATLW